jgi:hypothetical protein
MVWILSRIQANPDRQALHHFDVIAGRVLRRQKTREFASRTRQTFYISLVIASGSINVDCNRLAAMHSRN